MTAISEACCILLTPAAWPQLRETNIDSYVSPALHAVGSHYNSIVIVLH